MSIDKLKEALPDYAKDLKLNLSNLVNNADDMTEQQLWGSLLAAAIGSRNPEVVAEIQEEAAQHLSDEAQFAAKAAAAIMGMNNVYYRYMHMSPNKELSKLPAKLRMNVMMNPGVDKVDFELWSLVVSAINACSACIVAHEKELTEKEVDKTVVQHAVRIAAVVHAIAATLEAEKAMSGATA